MTGSRPIFRVSFSGPSLESDTMSELLDGPDRCWEGRESDGGPTENYRALVGARSEEDAVASVSDALAEFGAFSDFRAEPLRDTRGGVKHTPIRKLWRDVDWDEVESKVALSEFERALISTFLDAAEPTWIIVKDLDLPGDRERAEATLRDLERRGLVHSTWEPSGGPEDSGVIETWRGRPELMCHWWALTEEGWDLLGLIKSPRYR